MDHHIHNFLNNCRRTAPKEHLGPPICIVTTRMYLLITKVGRTNIRGDHKLSCVYTKLAETFHLGRLARLDVKQRRKHARPKPVVSFPTTCEPVRQSRAKHMGTIIVLTCALYLRLPIDKLKSGRSFLLWRFETHAGKASSDATGGLQSLTMRVFLVDSPKPHVNCKHGARMRRVDFERVHDDDLLLEHACPTACSLVRSFLSADERPARATFYGANGVGFDGVSSFSASTGTDILAPPSADRTQANTEHSERCMRVAKCICDRSY
jgi:hypothetical protein